MLMVSPLTIQSIFVCHRKLSFLKKSTCPKIAYDVHQCACFMELPTKPHGVAVKHIGCYLLAIPDKVIILNPSLELFDSGLMHCMLVSGENMVQR